MTVVRYSSSDTSTSATAILVGNGLLLLWDSTAAAAIVMQRPLLKHHSPITLSAVTVSIAAVVLGVLVPWYEGTSNSNWTLSVTAQVTQGSVGLRLGRGQPTPPRLQPLTLTSDTDHPHPTWPLSIAASATSNINHNRFAHWP